MRCVACTEPAIDGLPSYSDSPAATTRQHSAASLQTVARRGAGRTCKVWGAVSGSTPTHNRHGFPGALVLLLICASGGHCRMSNKSGLRACAMSAEHLGLLAVCDTRGNPRNVPSPGQASRWLDHALPWIQHAIRHATASRAAAACHDCTPHHQSKPPLTMGLELVGNVRHPDRPVCAMNPTART